MTIEPPVQQVKLAGATVCALGAGVVFCIAAFVLGTQWAPTAAGSFFIGLVFVAALGTRVGYRRRDVAFALVPIYGFFHVVRIIWRAFGGTVSEEAGPVPIEFYRHAVFVELTEDGVPKIVAQNVALCIYPFDDGHAVTPSLRAQLQTQAQAFAIVIQNRDARFDLRTLCFDRLRTYLETAQKKQDKYLQARYLTALETLKPANGDVAEAAVLEFENAHAFERGDSK